MANIPKIVLNSLPENLMICTECGKRTGRNKEGLCLGCKLNKVENLFECSECGETMKIGTNNRHASDCSRNPNAAKCDECQMMVVNNVPVHEEYCPAEQQENAED